MRSRCLLGLLIIGCSSFNTLPQPFYDGRRFEYGRRPERFS